MGIDPDRVQGSARERILARLRRAEPLPPTPAEVPVRRFDWSPEECLARFRARMEAVRGEVIRVGDDWPTRLAAVLETKGVGNLAFGPEGPHAGALTGGWPATAPVALLPWTEPAETGRDALFERVDAAFTSCRGAVAETGSLVLWSTAAEPRMLSLVPPVHVVWLAAAAIRSTLHEVLVAEGWADGMPTNALLVSGPSKSADIEQTLAYGVHGPRELIVLVDSPAGGAARW